MTNFYKKYLLHPVNIILLFLIIIFFPLIFSGKTLFYRDISMQDFPLMGFVINSLKNFEFPLWNPYLFCGFPQMASLQPPLFYPLTIIYYFFPFSIAMGIFLVIHYFIAGLGIYLIERYWQQSKISSLIGGIVFSLNSYLFEWNSLQFMLIAITWLPFIFLFTEKLLDKLGYRNFFYLLVFLALQVLTGRLDFLYFSFLICLFQFSYRLIQRRVSSTNTPYLRNLIFIFLAFAFALMLAAIQVLPSIEFIHSTKRGSGIELNVAMMFSINPWHLFMLLFNNLYGDNYLDRGISPLAAGDFSFFLYNLYIGFPAFLLAIYSFFQKEEKTKFLLFIAVFFLLLALGKYTPLYQFLYNYFPGINLVRYPVKFFVFTIFSLSLLAGMGTDLILKKGNPITMIKLVLTSFILVLTAILVFLFFERSIIFHFNEQLTQYNLDIKNISFIYKSMSSSLLIIFLFGILLFLLKNQKITIYKFSILLVILIGFDFINNNIANLWVVDKNMLLEKPPVVADIEKRIGDRRLYRIIKPLETAVPLVNSSKRISDLLNNIFTLNSNLNIIYSLNDAYGYYPGEPSKVYPLFSLINNQVPGKIITDKERSNIMKILGVRFYIWHIKNTSIPSPDPRYFTLLAGYENITQLWEVKGFKSRFSFKTKFLKIDTDDKIMKAVLNPERFNIDDNTVILKDFTDSGKNMFTYEQNMVSNVNIKLISETSNTLTLDVKNLNSGFLTIASIFDKGWQCFVDGQPSEIINANFQQQAVKLEKGRHTVYFRYHPYSFVLGKYISVFSLLGLIICFILSKDKLERLPS